MTDIVDVNGIPLGSSDILSKIHQAGGAPSTVPYISTQLYACTGIGHLESAFGTSLTFTSRLYYVPFFCSSNAIFTGVTCFVDSGSGATTTLGVALYASNSSLQPTGSPIANSNVTSASFTSVTPTLRAATFSSPIQLIAGTLYFVGLQMSQNFAHFDGSYAATTNASISCLGYSGSPVGATLRHVIMSYSQAATYNATFPSVGTLTALTDTVATMSAYLQAQ